MAVITKTVKPGGGGDYTSLAAWESAEQTNLVTDGDTHVCECYTGGDLNQVSIDGWTTDATHFITITSPDGEYHAGDINAGAYIDANSSYVSCYQAYTVIEKLRCQGGDPGWPRYGIYSFATNITIRRNVIKDGQNGIYLHESDGGYSCIAHNNLIVGVANSGIYSLVTTSTENTLLNNTIVDCPQGITCTGIRTGGSNYDDVRNNICLGNTTNYDMLATAVVANYNAGESGNMPPEGANNVTTTKALTFNDPDNDDYSHLKYGSCIETGIYIAGYPIDIIGGERPLSGSGSPFDIGCFHAEIIYKSIGTTGRDYSTITAWESARQGVIANRKRSEAGECFADSDFNETINIDGWTGDVSHHIILTVAPGERHNGTSTGGGVVIDRGGATGTVLQNNESFTIIEWLRITNWTGSETGFSCTGWKVSGAINVIRNNIIHNENVSTGVQKAIILGDFNNYASYYVMNNIIYSMTGGGVEQVSQYPLYSYYWNNTVWNVNRSGSTYYHGLSAVSSCTSEAKNNISMDTGGTTDDFNGFDTQAYNLSSDATATGTGSLINKDSADQFVSETTNSEDLHLKSGADAIGVGTDLGTTQGVNIDIDGYDRNA